MNYNTLQLEITSAMRSQEVKKVRKLLRERKNRAAKQSVKVLVLGDDGVGKSSLICTLISNHWNGGKEMPDVYTDISVPENGICDNKVQVIIMDSSQNTSVEELKNKIHECDSIVLVYDIEKTDTLDHLMSYWLPLISKTNTKVPVILAGNKVETRSDTLGSEESHLLGERRKAEVAPLLARYRNHIWACYECSAKTQQGVIEVFHIAQHMVVYPIGPLYDIISSQLTTKCAHVISRIFRFFDQDCDGLLNENEINKFQMHCFEVAMDSDEFSGMFKVIMSKTNGNGVKRIPTTTTSSPSASGGTSSIYGVTLEGFQCIIKLFIEKDKFETPWMLFRLFGYDDELNIHMETRNQNSILPSTSSSQSIHVLSLYAVKFLKKIFKQFCKIKKIKNKNKNKNNIKNDGTDDLEYLTCASLNDIFQVVPFQDEMGSTRPWEGWNPDHWTHISPFSQTSLFDLILPNEEDDSNDDDVEDIDEFLRETGGGTMKTDSPYKILKQPTSTSTSTNSSPSSNSNQPNNQGQVVYPTTATATATPSNMIDGVDDLFGMSLNQWIGLWHISASLNPTLTQRFISYLGYTDRTFEEKYYPPIVDRGSIINKASSDSNNINTNHKKEEEDMLASEKDEEEEEEGYCFDKSQDTVIHVLVIGSKECGKSKFIQSLSSSSSSSSSFSTSNSSNDSLCESTLIHFQSQRPKQKNDSLLCFIFTEVLIEKNDSMTELLTNILKTQHFDMTILCFDLLSTSVSTSLSTSSTSLSSTSFSSFSFAQTLEEMLPLNMPRIYIATKVDIKNHEIKMMIMNMIENNNKNENEIINHQNNDNKENNETGRATEGGPKRCSSLHQIDLFNTCQAVSPIFKHACEYCSREKLPSPLATTTITTMKQHPQIPSCFSSFSDDVNVNDDDDDDDSFLHFMFTIAIQTVIAIPQKNLISENKSNLLSPSSTLSMKVVKVLCVGALASVTVIATGSLLKKYYGLETMSAILRKSPRFRVGKAIK